MAPDLLGPCFHRRFIRKTFFESPPYASSAFYTHLIGILSVSVPFELEIHQASILRRQDTSPLYLVKIRLLKGKESEKERH